MPNVIRVGSIAGIPFQVHYTWLLALFLVTWSLASGFFPSTHPSWSPETYWLAAIIGAMGLFASVLLHELAHSLVALQRGLGVHSITLFVFGGVSSIEDEAEEPKDELLFSIVGPLTSFALAAVAWGLLSLIVPADTVPGAILSYLAVVNVLLGSFNLLPGFPLDGGRVLRSIIWSVTGNLHRATDIAASAGQGLSFLFIVWGVVQILGGNFLGGMWIAFLGWFLNTSAEASRQQIYTREILRGIRVGELMNPRPLLAYPELDTRSFVLDYVMRQGIRALPVVQGGRLIGIVSITDAREVPPELWPVTPVRAIMTPTPLKTASPGTDIASVLKTLVDGGIHQVPVVEGDRLVGMLTRADLLRYLQLSAELGLSGNRHTIVR